MDKPEIIVETVAPGAKLPEYAHDTDSGADLFCLEGFTLFPGEIKTVPTGIRLALPEGYEVQVRSKSGLARHYGVHVLNSPGTVDCGYRGDIMVILKNSSAVENVTFMAGDKIAQMVVAPYVQAHFVRDFVNSEDSHRSAGGFGSTGR